MATVKKTVKYETKTYTVTEEVPVIKLTLSQDEAQLLRDILGTFVVGNYKLSRRKFSSAIYDALEPHTDSRDYNCADDLSIEECSTGLKIKCATIFDEIDED